MISCDNVKCGKNKQNDKRESFCTLESIRLKKVWEGLERDYNLICLEATNKTNRHPNKSG
jgi:hypothetical protein